MTHTLLVAAAFATFVWWFATGAILYLDGLPKRTFGRSLGVFSVLAAAALVSLALTRGEATTTNVYLAFASAIMLWGWIELSFLTGLVTGPRRSASIPGTTTAQRFRHACGTIAYHEAAILLIGVLVIALTWGQPNAVGAWAFIVLWAMRTSAKLNLFLGVRNDGRELLPDRLQYLASFFANRTFNALFPVSVAVATIVAMLLVRGALDASSGAQGIGYALVATLLILGIIEHWLMVLPLPATALWGWGLKSRAAHPDQ